jgi:hypothetical protein
MAIRILSLVVVSMLSGCAFPNLYKGPALPTCQGPVTDPRFSSGACMTGAEYDIARKKALHARKEAAVRDWKAL